MTQADVVQRVIGEIYDAAGNVERWAICLESIRKLLDCTAAHLIYHDHRSHEGAVTAAAGLDPTATDAYAAYYHGVDPWLLRLTADSAQPGTVVLGQSLIPHSEMIRTEYYAGLGKRYDLTRSLGAILERPSPTRSANLGLNRSDRAPAFSDGDARLMSLLVPHLQRALAIHRRLTHLDAQRSAATDVIDTLECGVILVDDRLRPVLVNRAARRTLGERDGLFLDRDALKASTPSLTAKLRELVASAAAITSRMSLIMPHGALRIARPSPVPPLQLVITPLSTRNWYAGAEGLAVAAIFVSDPRCQAQPDAHMLQALHGFTRAETRVAALLARGRSVAEMAQELGFTIGTARWYVKQLRAKTGTTTQAQLMRVLVGGLATVK